MTKVLDKKLGALVSENFKRAQILEKYNLDFLGGKNKTLSEAIREQALDTEKIIKELEQEIAGNETLDDFQNWPLDRLIDFLIQTYFQKIRKLLPEAGNMGNKLAMKHSADLPEVGQIAELFNRLSYELKNHLSNEEHHLFPYIKTLNQSLQTGKALNAPVFGTFENPRRILEHEHRQFWDYLFNIRSLSDNYQASGHAPAEVEELYEGLKKLDILLKRLFHLENDLVFPRASQMERVVVKRE